MNNFILLPKPYLRRSIPAEKLLIDQKINSEINRVRRLMKFETTEMASHQIRNFENLKAIESTLPVPATNVVIKGKSQMKTSKTLEQTKDMSANQVTSNLSNINKLTISDFITNTPNGNFSIGYICPLTFTSKLDYQRIWGTVTSTFVWYFVPQDGNGNYLVDTNGILLGYYSQNKNVLTTEETVKWHWDYDLYNLLNFPTVKFKIAVKRFDNGMPGGSTLSDEIVITFNNAPCININSMNISASNSDGGYPSIKGGDHGSEPTINVYLDAPAPPTGQIVNLSITGAGNVNPVAWINNGNAQKVISGGQTHGQWDGIIGSRHVYSTKDIHVVANVNGVDGVSTLRVTKN
jgi:hypothetical protein